jgi:peptidoglycan/LPS O-acetylase OafA/YrhL
MNFRKDINGLRAIAVIAVVIFHFNAAWLPGGFAGVDVFFVISGFLMTSIIFRGLEQEKFSVIKFYVARANRIIPALATLCIILLILGCFFFMPSVYKDLGKHISSSMSFFSNIIYWNEAGYFDTESHKKWLLHTWSLSVEWQFYILYPLLLIVLRNYFSLKFLKQLIVIFTTICFSFCVYITFKNPDFSYYSLPTRAWEMMLGGIAYLYPLKLKERSKIIVECTGLFLILGSYFFISEDNLWPGYLALFPVMGAFFIIQAQRQDSFFTNNVVFQKLGTWSYSIYLWHWPLVVTIYTFQFSSSSIYIGVILSVLFGFLSNKYIENIKFKKYNSSFESILKCYPLYLAISIILLGAFIWANKGDNAWHLFQTEGIRKTYTVMQKSSDSKADWKPFKSNIQNQSSCRFKVRSFTVETQDRLINCYKRHGEGTLVLGDSHAIDLYWLLYSRFEDKFIFGIPIGGCRPHTPQKECLYSDIKDFVSKNHVFKHAIYEQSGSYLLLNKNGEKGTRAIFSSLSLSEAVEGVTIDKLHIKYVNDYLLSLSEFLKVTWFGSRVEPHFSNNEVLTYGCDFDFKLRKNQYSIFNELDNYISSHLPKSSNLRFISQNRTINYIFPEDFMDCNNLYWNDGDHLSDAGEKRFGLRLPNNFLLSW